MLNLDKIDYDYYERKKSCKFIRYNLNQLDNDKTGKPLEKLTYKYFKLNPHYTNAHSNGNVNAKDGGIDGIVKDTKNNSYLLIQDKEYSTKEIREPRIQQFEGAIHNCIRKRPFLRGKKVYAYYITSFNYRKARKSNYNRNSYSNDAINYARNFNEHHNNIKINLEGRDYIKKMLQVLSHLFQFNPHFKNFENIPDKIITKASLNEIYNKYNKEKRDNNRLKSTIKELNNESQKKSEELDDKNYMERLILNILKSSNHSIVTPTKYHIHYEGIRHNKSNKESEIRKILHDSISSQKLQENHNERKNVHLKSYSSKTYNKDETRCFIRLYKAGYMYPTIAKILSTKFNHFNKLNSDKVSGILHRCKRAYAKQHHVKYVH